MKHYGDITKINGGEVEAVWCITGGSPCQDLSVAGKGAGLAGERSGLFHEQIRIIKEMRANVHRVEGADELLRLPRYSVWENVWGAASSNHGEDFRCVLEEFARIAEPTVSVPLAPRGKWSKAGVIEGDGWQIAWRLHDAQYWGVPQRRRRIALVCDFDGYNAAAIVFGGGRNGRSSGDTDTDASRGRPRSERGGEVRPLGGSGAGHNPQVERERQGSAGDTANRSGSDDSESVEYF